jgi:anti-sigma factor RsiW
MKECLRYLPMIGAKEGELEAAEEAALRAHLAACASCRATQAAFRATDGVVAEALLAQAGRRDFAPFVDGVMERIERGRARSPWAKLGRWLESHRRAAFATAAPILAALALVVYVRHEQAGHHELALLEVDAEGAISIVLQTQDGPLVLLGAAEPEGS